MEKKKDGISFIEPLSFHDGLFYSGLLAGALTLGVIMSGSPMQTVRGNGHRMKVLIIFSGISTVSPFLTLYDCH